MHNRLHRYDFAVRWAYALALLEAVITEWLKNSLVPVWPVSVLNFIRNRWAQLPQDERAKVYL